MLTATLAAHCSPEATSSDVPTLELQGQTMIIVGTLGDDVIDIQMDETEHVVTINDFTCIFDAADINEIHVGGAQGENHVTVRGSAFVDRGSAINGRSELHSSAYSLFTYSMSKTTMFGGRGVDRVQLYGSSQSDQVESFMEGSTTLTTPEHEYVAWDFERVDAYGLNGGYDVARLYGTDNGETFSTNISHAWLQASSYLGFADRFLRYTTGFERVDAYGGGGIDEVLYQASESRNRFVSTPSYVLLTDESVRNVAWGFRWVTVNGVGGNDAAFVYDADSYRDFPLAPTLYTFDRGDRDEAVRDFGEVILDGTRIGGSLP